MPPLFRIILIFFLIYVVYRSIKYLMGLFVEKSDSDGRFNKNKSGEQNKSGIDKKDIIDAEFEDLDESDKSK